MTAYVRVRKLDHLRRRIQVTGTQADVAAAAGLTTTRLSQICVGEYERLAIDKAMRLERALGVPYGALFEACDRALLTPYLDDSDTSGDTSGDVNTDTEDKDIEETESADDTDTAPACSVA